MNGLELARKLREKNSDDYLVFITSKDDLAYKVFEYQLDVLDYIMKKTKILSGKCRYGSSYRTFKADFL